MPRRAKLSFVRTFCLLSVGVLLAPLIVRAQVKLNYDPNKPVDLVAIDPQIRALLSEPPCGKFNINDTVNRAQEALNIADSGGLIRDRALVEARLASAFLARAQLELGFAMFQKALQDAIESKNGVLEADILISLASEAQLKGNIQQGADLISSALGISERIGSLYEKSHALGELGIKKLAQGKREEGAALIDEAIQIDKLNGYKFEAIHLDYRAVYLGLAGKVDEAVDTAIQARTKALLVRDAYSFVTAESTYAYGLVQKGRIDDAIEDMSLLKQGEFEKFSHDAPEQACLASAFALPILHLTLLEDLANILEAANLKDKESEVWHEVFNFSSDQNFLAGEAEAAQKIADLDNQLKDTDDALKYYGIAADLYRKLQNEPFLTQVEVSQSLMLIHANRGKEALALEQEVASYAERHNLRWQEFTAYGVLSEIYQPAGDLQRALDMLEKARSLVRPGPFDDEFDNRVVLEDYLRIGDIYRALKIPIQELRAVEDAFVVAMHLKDEKVQQNLVGYLDQRLKDLGIRELVGQLQKDGKLPESLFYSSVLYIRDGTPKPGDGDSNWNRILTLPFQIMQTPDGAKALTEVLNEVDSFLGFPKVALLDALSRYYITSGNDPVLAEKYALRSEEIKKGLTGNVSSLRAESACTLAVAYLREVKNSLARTKLAECSKFANESNDEESLKFAAMADVLVQIGIGDPASAKDSVEQLLVKVPDNPELHVELAMALANSKLYEKAASQLDIAVAKFTTQGDRKTTADAYVRVATAFNSDDSPKAQELQLEYLNSGHEIYRELNAQAEEASTLNALGEYYLRFSQVNNAVDSFDKAYELAQKANLTYVRAQTLSDLGNAYWAQKEFVKARDFHEKAVTAYRELQNPGLEAFSLQNLARDHDSMNETGETLSILLEAKTVAERAPALNQYFADVSLGEFYREHGQYEKSLATFGEAGEVTKRAGDTEHCADSHIAIAELDTMVGSWEDAVRDTQIALNLFQDIGDKKGQAAGWAVLTGIYSERSSSLKNFDKAQECYRKALELGGGENLRFELIEIYLQTGKYAEATKIAKDDFQRCAQANNDCRANVLITLSEAQRLNGDINAARSSLNEALPLASKSQDLYLRGRLLYGEARQLTSEHKLNEALASYEKLISLIETVRGNLDAKEQRSISENYGYIYNELVSLLYSMSKGDRQNQLRWASKSLEYAEINKARQFVESWGRTFVDQMHRGLPASTQETERSLFAKRDRLLADMNESAGNKLSAKGHPAEDELVTVQKDIATFLRELRRTSPQYAAVAYPEAIQISTLPLRRQETLIEFKMTDDSTFVWVVQNRNGSNNELVSFYKVPQTRAWFLNHISLLRASLNSGHPETIDWRVSEEIFAALFPGGESAVITESQSVLFIPDDVLFALPFELYSPNASKGDFVFLKKASAYYPSAVSFQIARAANHKRSWQEAFLGLADPITSPEDERYEAAKVVHASFTQSSGVGAEDIDAKGESSDVPERLKARGFLFERLPGTAIEVRSVANLLQKTNEKAEVRVGIEATKTALLETDLSKFRFLHFATHGVLPVDTGVKEPALVLSYDGIAPEHMFLSMSEILGLKLDAESVVLSACNTGSGNISRAEGVMSLGRAFLLSGHPKPANDGHLKTGQR